MFQANSFDPDPAALSDQDPHFLLFGFLGTTSYDIASDLIYGSEKVMHICSKTGIN